MRRLDGGDELSDGLVAFWPLDEAGGNSFFDISRYGNHGRGVNGPARRTGRNGVATLFDGADDYVSVPAKSPVNLSRAVSLSVWINPAGWGESNFGRIIDKDNGGNGWAIYLDNSFVSSGLGWRFGGTTGSLANCITLNVWQHVLVTTPDANNFYVFVNGVLRGSAGGGAGIGTTTTALAIGNRGSDTARAFNGQMANLRLWNKPRWIGEARRLASDPWAGTLRELRRVWYLPAGGTTWDETISDAATAADSLAAALTGAGSLSDAATGGESLAAALGGVASLSDPATLADSLAAAVAMVATVADGGTLGEALAVALTGNASVSDSAAGGDAVSLGNIYAETLSDALTAADSLAVGLVVLEALAGSVAGADALAAALAAAGSTADAATAADALAATLAAVASLGGGGVAAADSLYLAPLTTSVPPARRTYRLNAAARRAVLAQQLRAYVLAAASRTTRLPEDDDT